MKEYDVPDEHLNYSELKDRIKAECVRHLPAKERILLMAKKLKEDLTLKNTICEQICNDLADATSVRWIQKCLPDEYKKRKSKKTTEQSTGELTNSSLIEDKNVPEQKAMTVEIGGYERSFEDISRKDDVPSSEIVEQLKKEVVDITNERDNLSTEVKVLKQKTQPELFREIQEKFYDKPGLLDAKTLQKVSLQAGRELETYLRYYNSIIHDAIESGKPVPLGTYIITKPDMKLVPVRVMVNFDRRKIEISLWEKKLECHN
jgi:hypothetical protein